MGRTKKVRKTGRLGSRYGVGIRKRLLKIEDKQRKYYKCPSCGYEKAQRKAPGIYSCRKCNNKFAGGAYLPVTLPGSIVQKMVSQRSFLPKVKELLVATEAKEKAITEREEKPGKGKEREEKPEKKEKPKKEGKQKKDSGEKKKKKPKKKGEEAKREKK